MEQILTNAIEAKELCFSYDRPVFDKISFAIPVNSITGIIGSNGAGKTTLFDLFCGIKKPDGGILKNCTCHPAYLSQTVSTSPALKLGDLFDMVSNLSTKGRITRADAHSFLLQWSPSLAQRFDKLSSCRPAQCSYGEIRYYFALALLVAPNDLVLLDEPTAGVDPEHRYYIWQAIFAAKATGKTIIVSSHNLQEVAYNTDLFWFINKRQITAFRSQAEFLRRYGGNDLDEAFIKACNYT